MKKGILLTGAAVAAIAAVAIYLLSNPAVTEGRSSGVNYLTSKVTRGPLISTVTATGRVKAVMEVEVGSQLSGQIAEVFVDFNDNVVAGQSLARLDTRTQEARLREAAANLEVARAQVLLQQAAVAVANENIASADARYQEAKRKLERTEKLRSNGTVSQAAVDEAQAEFQSGAAALRGQRAQLRVKQAELQDAQARVAREEALLAQVEIEMSRTLITAPIDGVIVGRGIEEGQTVAVSLQSPTLFEIAQDLSEMEVHVSVDEADIGQIKIGQPIAFTVDAYPAREFAGDVVQIRKSPQVTNNVVTYTVVVSAENPELLLLPGMTATVRMIVLEEADVIRIPNAALRFRPPGALMQTYDNDSADSGPERMEGGRPATVWVPGLLGSPKPVRVSVGASDSIATQLLSGPVAAGDDLIVGVTRIEEKPSVFGVRLGS